MIFISIFFMKTKTNKPISSLEKMLVLSQNILF